jgi:ubiquitin C-terminal hydrolase
MLYHICSKFLQPITSQGDMIDDVIGPGLSNPGQFCYLNPLVQTLFHILPLRLLVVGWPNGQPTITKLRAVFVVMAQGKMTSAISMEQICEEHVRGAQDCSELAIQIFEALRESAPESLQPIIQSLICFELSSQVPFWDGVREVAQPPAF